MRKENIKRMDYGVSVNFDTTFEDLLKKIKGQGEVLPVDILFRQWPEENGWIEPGMRALLVDMVEYDDCYIQAYLYFGQHEEYNSPFFKKEFTIIGDDSNRKLDAIESGHYEKRTHVLFDKNEKVHKFLKFN